MFWQAKSREISCSEKSNERKELENELERKRQALEAVKNQHSEIIKHLHSVQEQKPVLENQVSESHLMVGELEEKIVSAVELLISFKARRDKLRIEHEGALREVRELRRSVMMESLSFCGPLILSFTFEEIMDATCSFDPSCKIGEGDYGTMCKGVLRHMDVAIKMLPSSLFRGSLDFQHKVRLAPYVIPVVISRKTFAAHSSVSVIEKMLDFS